MPYIVLGCVIAWLRLIRNSRAQTVPDANFFGQQSLGIRQVRGGGALALVDDEIYFLRWLPQREYIVPLRDIESVEIVKSFLRKTVFRDIVKINFRNEDGESDAMAWLVKDPYNLKELLEELLSAKS
jgi:hypothetical protein